MEAARFVTEWCSPKDRRTDRRCALSLRVREVCEEHDPHD